MSDQEDGAFESLETRQEKNVGSEQRSIEGWILMVRGLHEEISEDHVYDAFGDCGELKNLHLNVDRRTGFAKGYALIEFETHREAKGAIDALDGRELLGQIVNVDWAFVKPSLSENGYRTHGYRRERSPSE